MHISELQVLPSIRFRSYCGHAFIIISFPELPSSLHTLLSPHASMDILRRQKHCHSRTSRRFVLCPGHRNEGIVLERSRCTPPRGKDMFLGVGGLVFDVRSFQRFPRTWWCLCPRRETEEGGCGHLPPSGACGPNDCTIAEWSKWHSPHVCVGLFVRTTSPLEFDNGSDSHVLVSRAGLHRRAPHIGM